MAFTEDQRGSLYFPQFPFIPLWTFPLLPPLFSLFCRLPPSSDLPFPCELWTPKIIHPRSSFLCPLRRTSVREGGRLPLRRRQAASDGRTRNRRNKTKSGGRSHSSRRQEWSNLFSPRPLSSFSCDKHQRRRRKNPLCRTISAQTGELNVPVSYSVHISPCPLTPIPALFLLLSLFAGMATNVSLELYVASLGSINTENMVRKLQRRKKSTSTGTSLRAERESFMGA